MLKDCLSESNILFYQAESDTDRLIVITAINDYKDNVVIVSEDTDVLVLLNALAKEEKEVYFIKPGKGKTGRKIYFSKSLHTTFPKCQEHIFFFARLYRV